MIGSDVDDNRDVLTQLSDKRLAFGIQGPLLLSAKGTYLAGAVEGMQKWTDPLSSP